MHNTLSSEHIEQRAKTVDEWLNGVDYTEINTKYRPSPFAFKFVQFVVNIVNDGKGDSEPTPPVHLKMLDGLTTEHTHIANLCSRGLAKTTLFAEYLFLYIACFGEIDGFGKVHVAMYVADSMDNGAKNLRKNLENRYLQSQTLQKFVPTAKFTDKRIEFVNADGHKFGLGLFGAKTGIRGNKMYGKRPTLAVLDDLVSDEDAKSKTEMEAIKDTVYNGVDHALDPTKKKIIFNGTPFNKNDVLYEAVESGGWYVNVYPICERYPCEEHEFVGAWPERFSYEFVKNQYELAMKTGRIKSFNQELMLRIASDEERMIQESWIQYYSRTNLMTQMQNYHYYITTDFAVSSKESADYSVIIVWAYDYNGNWYLVDGICKKQEMDANLNDLFRLVQIYNPQSVGVEVTGQQSGFISWIRREQEMRNMYFSFARSGSRKEPGIRPVTDKLTRMKMAVPLFATGKIFFPKEISTEKLMVELLDELRMAMYGGFKSKHDDVLDNISMLPLLEAIKPSMPVNIVYNAGTGIWSTEDPYAPEEYNPMESYIV